MDGRYDFHCAAADFALKNIDEAILRSLARPQIRGAGCMDRTIELCSDLSQLYCARSIADKQAILDFLRSL
jgi:hypothetical protein